MLATAAATAALTGVVIGTSGAAASGPTCLGHAVTIKGTLGPDTLTGTDKPDVIDSFDSNDTIKGLGGNDLLCAGGGSDTVIGGPRAGKSEGFDGGGTPVGGVMNTTAKG